MIKFAYITDTHLGASEGAWGQQPTYPHLVPQLFDDLKEYLQKHPVDFILHGGDVTDGGTDEQRKQLADIVSDMPCRFFVTLGNHDLSQKESLSCWRESGKLFFNDNMTDTCDFSLELGNVKLVVMTNTWQNPESEDAFVWNKELGQYAGFTGVQYDWLESQVSDGMPVILSIHETLYPLNMELTEMDGPIHEPPGEYVKKICEFVETHPQIKCVLSGHCHASCRTRHASAVHITSAAYFEPPFQMRIIEINDKSIDVTVAYPIDLKKYAVEINKERMWSAGKWYDWRIQVTI